MTCLDGPQYLQCAMHAFVYQHAKLASVMTRTLTGERVERISRSQRKVSVTEPNR